MLIGTIRSAVYGLWEGTSRTAKFTLAGGTFVSIYGLSRLAQNPPLPPKRLKPLPPVVEIKLREPAPIEKDAQSFRAVLKKGLGPHSVLDLLSREGACDGYIKQLDQLVTAFLKLVALGDGDRPDLIRKRVENIYRYLQPLLDEWRQGLRDENLRGLFKWESEEIEIEPLISLLSKLDAAAVYCQLAEGDAHLLSEAGQPDLQLAAGKLSKSMHKLASSLTATQGKPKWLLTVIDSALSLGQTIVKTDSYWTALKVYVPLARKVIDPLLRKNWFQPMVKRQLNHFDLFRQLTTFVKEDRAPDLSPYSDYTREGLNYWREFWTKNPEYIELHLLFLNGLERHRKNVENACDELYDLLRDVVTIVQDTAYDHREATLFKLIWNDLANLGQAAKENKSEEYEATMRKVLAHIREAGEEQRLARLVLAARGVLDDMVKGDVPGYSEASAEEFQRTFPPWFLGILTCQLERLA